MNNDYEICGDATKRHDFVLLFDVTDGNPNGDPDAGNLPRVDPETMQGLVSDVCLKRKVRNYLDIVGGETEAGKIYVQDKGLALNTLHGRAYSALGIKSTGAKQNRDDVNKAREWMCANFIDVRLFGAVMTTGVNCGQVRGPLQLTFARSVDPIIPLDISITRVAITKEEDTKVLVAEGEEEGTGGKRTEMGRKPLLAYGLYRGAGFYSPRLAQCTGASTADLALFWDAMRRMWEQDRSASRGMMACRGLYVFTHENPLGNMPTHELFERIVVERKPDIETTRKFGDYNVKVDDAGLAAQGVTLTTLIPSPAAKSA